MLLSTPTLKEDSGRISPEGKHSVILLTMVEYKHFERSGPNEIEWSLGRPEKCKTHVHHKRIAI